MPCSHPLVGTRLPDGKISVRTPSPYLSTASVPCGQCLFCRRQRALSYAVQILHETDQHEQNAFVTLTYSDKKTSDGFYAKYDNSGLAPEHISQFFKKFRQRIYPQRIKHFSVGEYGERNNRPHYHSIIFGWYPSPRDITKVSDTLVTSALLEDVWGWGFVSVGYVTPESASYVAGYSIKKITGKNSEEHYFNPETGEHRKPEFLRLSNHLGGAFAARLTDDEFVTGVAHQGGVVPTPRKYKKKLKELDPERYARIQAAIEARPHDFKEQNRVSKLVAPGKTVQDVVDLARVKNRKREL